MNLIRWIKALSSWIIEPQPLWLCILVVGASLYLAFTGRVSEPKIRILGMFLQLAGLATVAWGLRETRQLFGYPGLFEHAAEWVRRFPKCKPTPISMTANITLPGVQLTASGYSWQSFDPEAPIEKRLAAVEANLLDVNRRLDEIKQWLHHESHKITSELHEEQILREREDEMTRRKLDLSQTGGLSISAMGLVWLLLGLILSTASTEIAKLFN
jgi:hypothetical protein